MIEILDALAASAVTPTIYDCILELHYKDNVKFRTSENNGVTDIWVSVKDDYNDTKLSVKFPNVNITDVSNNDAETLKVAFNFAGILKARMRIDDYIIDNLDNTSLNKFSFDEGALTLNSVSLNSLIS